MAIMEPAHHGHELWQLSKEPIWSPCLTTPIPALLDVVVKWSMGSLRGGRGLGRPSSGPPALGFPSLPHPWGTLCFSTCPSGIYLSLRPWAYFSPFYVPQQGSSCNEITVGRKAGLPPLSSPAGCVVPFQKQVPFQSNCHRFLGGATQPPLCRKAVQSSGCFQKEINNKK